MKWVVYAIFFALTCMGVYENSQSVDSFARQLTIWVDEKEVEVLTALNQTFEEQYNVKINLEVVSPDEVYTKLLSLPNSQVYPDVINMEHVMISDFANQQLIVPVNDIFNELDVLPTIKQGLKVKGDYYGVPYEGMTDVLYYDKSRFGDGIGSFELFENYRNLSIVLEYTDLYHINPFITGFGGDIVGTNNFGDTNFFDIRLNSEESVKGFTAMIQLLNSNVLYSKEGDIYETFITKKADLLIAPASIATSLSEYYPNLGYQEIPNFVEDVLPYTYMTMDTYQICSYSEQKDLAKEYLKFLVSDTVAVARYTNYRAVAPLDYEEPITKDEYYTLVKKQLHRSMPVPNQTEFTQLYIPYQKAVKQAISLPDQIQILLDNAVLEIDNALEKYLN